MAKKKAVKKVVEKKTFDLSKTQTKTVNTGGKTVTIDMSKEPVPETVSIPSAITVDPPMARIPCRDCYAYDIHDGLCHLNNHPQPAKQPHDWCVDGGQR